MEGSTEHAMDAIDYVKMAEDNLWPNWRSGHENLMRTILDPASGTVRVRAEVDNRAKRFTANSIKSRIFAEDMRGLIGGDWTNKNPGRKAISYLRTTNEAGRFDRALEIATGKREWSAEAASNEVAPEADPWAHVGDDARHAIKALQDVGAVTMGALSEEAITPQTLRAIEHAHSVFPVGWLLFPDLVEMAGSTRRFDQFAMGLRDRKQEFHNAVDSGNIPQLVGWLAASPGFERMLESRKRMEILNHIVKKFRDGNIDDVHSANDVRRTWNLSQIVRELDYENDVTVKETIGMLDALINTNLGPDFVQGMFDQRRADLRTESDLLDEGAAAEQRDYDQSYGAERELWEDSAVWESAAQDGTGMGTQNTEGSGVREAGARARFDETQTFSVGGADLKVQVRKGVRYSDPGERLFRAADEAENRVIDMARRVHVLQKDKNVTDAEMHEAVRKSDVAAAAAMKARSRANEAQLQQLQFIVASNQVERDELGAERREARREGGVAASDSERARRAAAEAGVQDVSAREQADIMAEFGKGAVKRRLAEERETEEKAAAVREERRAQSIADYRSEAERWQRNPKARAYAKTVWDNNMPFVMGGETTDVPAYTDLPTDLKALAIEAVNRFRLADVSPYKVRDVREGSMPRGLRGAVQDYTWGVAADKLRFVLSEYRERVRGKPRGPGSKQSRALALSGADVKKPTIVRRKRRTVNRPRGTPDVSKTVSDKVPPVDDWIVGQTKVKLGGTFRDMQDTEYAVAKTALESEMERLIGVRETPNVIIAKNTYDAMVQYAKRARQVNPDVSDLAIGAVALTFGDSVAATIGEYRPDGTRTNVIVFMADKVKHHVDEGIFSYRGIVAHELLGHGGLEGALTPKQFLWLYSVIEDWAKNPKHEKTPEGQVARAALQRLEGKGRSDTYKAQGKYRAELVAVFLENAVDVVYLDMTRAPHDTAVLRKFLESVRVMVRDVIRKLYGASGDITMEDVVYLAQGSLLRDARVTGQGLDFEGATSNPDSVSAERTKDRHFDEVSMSRVDILPTTPDTGRRAEQTETAIGQSMRETGVQFGRDLRSFYRKRLGELKFLHQFVDENRATLPSMDDWHREMASMEKSRNEIMEDARRIVNLHLTLNPKMQKQVNEFLADSTFKQQWGYRPEHDPDVVVHPAMGARFKKLNDTQKNVVRQVFAYGDRMRKEKVRIAKAAGIRDKDLTFMPTGSLSGPYAPLMRFGNHVVEMKSKELVRLQALPSPSAAVKRRIDKLKLDERHYAVSFFETAGQAARFADENRDDYFSVEPSERPPAGSDSRVADSRMVEEGAGLPGLRSGVRHGARGARRVQESPRGGVFPGHGRPERPHGRCAPPLPPRLRPRHDAGVPGQVHGGGPPRGADAARQDRERGVHEDEAAGGAGREPQRPAGCVQPRRPPLLRHAGAARHALAGQDSGAEQPVHADVQRGLPRHQHDAAHHGDDTQAGWRHGGLLQGVDPASQGLRRGAHGDGGQRGRPAVPGGREGGERAAQIPGDAAGLAAARPAGRGDGRGFGEFRAVPHGLRPG